MVAIPYLQQVCISLTVSSTVYITCRLFRYYGGNVLKGAVGCIPNGWNMALPLYIGSVSDSKYMTDEVLPAQEKWQEQEVNDGAPSITNITDKGVKCSVEAWQHGKQILETPSFRLNDQRHFFPSQTSRITSVAKDRAQNERMVKRPKLSHFLSGGVSLTEPMPLVETIWHNVNARSNFVYRPLKRKMNLF